MYKPMYDAKFIAMRFAPYLKVIFQLAKAQQQTPLRAKSINPVSLSGKIAADAPRSKRSVHLKLGCTVLRLTAF